ncbi:hypothetical protein EcWSU1_A044 (plasmid) [Enterobacter ludwigii]|uniref:Uncharacterized protein n=1 Tax=Enterobacter ludwigii TaxID=299767 RepID=G8LQC2_9ENTR|nr:hypothetical protein EcWSU1_A044 [Enterobacter ludwigii]
MENWHCGVRTPQWVFIVKYDIVFLLLILLFFFFAYSLLGVYLYSYSVVMA